MVAAIIRDAIGDEPVDAELVIRIIGIAWSGALYAWVHGQHTLDEVDRLPCAGVVHVGDGDPGSVLGEQDRRRPTLARRGAGDERNLAVEQSHVGHARTVREP